MARSDGFTSKQVDALQQFVEGADAYLQAFGQDYPEIAAEVDATLQKVKEWADS